MKKIITLLVVSLSYLACFSQKRVFVSETLRNQGFENSITNSESRNLNCDSPSQLLPSQTAHLGTTFYDLTIKLE
jgi:hypothetical protein